MTALRWRRWGRCRACFWPTAQPLEEAREIYCDTASLASLNLLKVLLAESGLKPELRPLPDYQGARALDNVLLIGDQALEFARAAPPHEIWDWARRGLS